MYLTLGKGHTHDEFKCLKPTAEFTWFKSTQGTKNYTCNLQNTFGMIFVSMYTYMYRDIPREYSSDFLWHRAHRMNN